MHLQIHRVAIWNLLKITHLLITEKILKHVNVNKKSRLIYALDMCFSLTNLSFHRLLVSSRLIFFNFSLGMYIDYSIFLLTLLIMQNYMINVVMYLHLLKSSSSDEYFSQEGFTRNLIT